MHVYVTWPLSSYANPFCPFHKLPMQSPPNPLYLTLVSLLFDHNIILHIPPILY